MANNFLRLTLIGKDQSASSTVDALTRKIRTAGATITGVGDKISGAGKGLSIGVTAPLAGLAGYAVKTEADFSKSMAQVAVATNAPKASLKGLSDYALEMGAKTVFSAGDAATAMLNLAKGGFTPAQIKGGALAATMNLAAAGGLNLDDAANDVVASMNTFNVSAGNASSITDALAGAANASSADVSDLAMALSQGGAAARATKQPLADTAGFLGLLADNGIRGSDAGTSMKTFLLGLVPNSASAAKAMRGLGLSFADSQGHIDKLPAVAAKLQAAFKGMGDDERIAAEKQMFGTDAFRAAEALYQSGPAKLKAYADAARAHGNAEKMASAQMSGTAGAIEQMRGSLETAALTIGQTIAPQVVQLAGIVTDLANRFGGLDDGQKQLVVSLALVAAAVGPVLFVTGKLISGVGSTITMFANARTAATNFGLGLKSAQAAGSATTGLAGTIGGSLRTVASGFTSGVAAAARWAAATAAAGARAAAGAVVSGAQVVGSLVAQGAAYVAAGARAAASTVAQLAVRGAQLAMAAATGVATAAQWLLNAAMSANPIGIVVVAIAALVAGLVWFFTQTKIGQQAWAAFTGFLRTAWAAIVTWFQTTLAQVVGFFTRFGPLILAAVAPFIGLPLLIISHWSQITTWFGKLPGLIGGFLANAATWLVSSGAKILDGLLDGAKTGLLAFGRWELGIISSVVGWVSGAAGWLVGTGQRLLGGLLDGAKTGLVALGKWELGLGATVIGWLKGAAGWLTDTGKQIIAGLVSGIRGGIGSAVSAVSSLINLLPLAARKLLGIASPSKVFREIGHFVGEGLKAGLNGSSSSVRSAMESLIGKVEDVGKKVFSKAGVSKSGLVKQLEGEEKDLVRLAKRRESLGDKLKKAQDKLADAIKTRDDYASSVKSSAVDGGNVASAFTTARSDADDAATKATDYAAKIADLDETVANSADDRQTLLDKIANVQDKQAAAKTVAGQMAAANQILTLQQELTNIDQRVAGYQTDRAALADKMAAAQATATQSPVEILVANLRKQVDKTSQFRTLLNQLKGQGLDNTTYAQLVGAGVDQGLSTAQALAADGTGAVSTIATLQGQLDTAAAQLGQTTATQLYQAGVDSAQALATSYQNQITVIDGAMGVFEEGVAKNVAKLGINTSSLMRSAGHDIADGLRIGVQDKNSALGSVFDDLGADAVRRLKRKLGIHSPSTVMHGIGLNTAEGARLGIIAGAAGVHRAIDGLIPTTGFQMPVGVSASSSGGWGGQTSQGGSSPMVHIENFHAGGLSADEVAAAFAWRSRWPS